MIRAKYLSSVKRCSVMSWCQRRRFHCSVTRLKNASPCRINPLQIQMLSEALHKQIFRDSTDTIADRSLKSVEKHLQQHGLWNRPTSIIDDVELKLPPLQGKSIEDHFLNIADRQIRDYKSLAEKIAQTELPPLPTEWAYTKGWTRYGADGSAVSVEYPQEDVVVFDIECLMLEGNYPTMATAVSDKHW